VAKSANEIKFLRHTKVANKHRNIITWY